MESLLSAGVLSLPWWAYVLITLVLTHITIVAVTVFLHRCQAHRALALHPLVSHFFRLWLWLTTGMVTKEWVAIHRKHHAKCDTPDDPHSPQIWGINRVLWGGVFLYVREARNPATLERYGHATPDDWIERIGLLALRQARGGTARRDRPLLIRYRSRRAHIRNSNRVDSLLGSGRDQRYRPLLGLS